MPTPEPVTYADVCAVARTLPGVEEGTAWRTPALRVRKQIMARLREDGETLAIRMDFGEREFRLQINPEVFYVTDHYAGYPMILVRLAKLDRGELHDLVYNAWRMVAPKRMREQYDQANSS